jgi:hypothetical protein
VKSRCILWCLAGLMVSHSVSAASLTVGGFNEARGGEESINENPGLQNLITTQFPGTIFSSSAELTPAYLSTINALIIGVAVSCGEEIKPLSVAEQTALLNFVKAGGTALLFGDNSENAKAANHSFTAPFGLSMAGTLELTGGSTIVNSSNPVVTGPAGTATGFDYEVPGWFSELGSAQKIAVLNAPGLKGDKQPSVAALLPGVPGTGSGATVFFSDSDSLIVSYCGISSTNDNILILNSLALAAQP